MTCRHRAGDPDCSSTKDNHYYQEQSAEVQRLQRQVEEQRALLKKPDNSQFEIIDCFEGTKGIVLKIKYDSCKDCAYEGTKVLVYVGSTTLDVIKWRIIDPHFRAKASGPREAPSPTARFPASDEGWNMAMRFLAQVEHRVER
jgi:hypothetical protein